MRVPALAPLLQKTEYDWSYQTEPHVHSGKALNDQVNKIFKRKG